MNSISELADAFERGKAKYEEAALNYRKGQFKTFEKYGGGGENILCLGDNLEYMIHLLNEGGMAGKIQMIYVDPPFCSGGEYQSSIRLKSEVINESSLIKIKAYDDRWSRGMSDYISMLTARLIAMRKLLSERGCIFIHLDWHSSHYVKIIADQVFGEKNFVNEIIWTYKSGGSSKRSFAKKHDTLLMYSKTGDYKFKGLSEKSYNRGFKPYRFKGVEEYQDEVGWYTLVNMKDVWNIDMVGRTSNERTGYATQKPEKLLERIIEACTEEGDICADFFAGSGTLAAACEKMNRQWIMCDEGEIAIAEQILRMGSKGSGFCVEKKNNLFEGKLDYSIDGVIVKLDSYHRELNDVAISENDEIKKYYAEDSLSLVKFWCIGETDDAGVYNAKVLIRDCSEFSIDELPTRCEDIRGYDYLGKCIIGKIKG